MTADVPAHQDKGKAREVPKSPELEENQQQVEARTPSVSPPKATISTPAQAEPSLPKQKRPVSASDIQVVIPMSTPAATTAPRKILAPKAKAAPATTPNQTVSKAANYPAIPGMTTVPYDSQALTAMDIDPAEEIDPSVGADPSMDIVPTNLNSFEDQLVRVYRRQYRMYQTAKSINHLADMKKNLDRVPTLVQGCIEAPHLAVRALSERGLEPVQGGQTPQDSPRKHGKSEPGGKLVPLTTQLNRAFQQERQAGGDIATWKDPQGGHIMARNYSGRQSSPTSQSSDARRVTQGGGASLQAPQARLDLHVVHSDLLNFRDTLLHEIHTRFLYIDEKVELLQQNNEKLSEFRLMSANTKQALENSLATANSLNIFSEILRANLSATDENKKVLDKTSAKIDNGFAKAFDKLHLNEDALRDILDKNRSLLTSITELHTKTDKLQSSEEDEQDKYESLTSDIDSTHQLLQNVASMVNDLKKSFGHLENNNSNDERASMILKQHTETQTLHLDNAIKAESGRLEKKLDSLINELRSSARVNHTTPSSHTIALPTHATTATTPRLGVPVSTHENSKSPPDNNNISRTTASDLSKDAPKVKDWPKFTGEGEYNHVEFIKTIEMFQEDFELRDIDITGKFCLIFQHSAKKWYLMIRKIHGKQPWAWWKEQINIKWGNAAWVYRMEEAFDKAHFEPGTSKPLVWFSKQKDRLSAIFPDMSESGLHERILKKCGGDLEHAVKCRTNRSSSTEDIINALEDIVERTKIGRRYNKSYTPSDNKTDPKKTTVNRLDNKPFVRKCHKCDSPDHLANVCTKPRKAINAIEQGTSNSSDEKETPTEEDEEESIPDESEGEDSNDLDISAIEANYNVTEEEMSSYLPQLSNPSREIVHITDAKLIKTRPEKGKGYTAGTSSITQYLEDI
ncbi:hypothetical protein PSTT_16340 [Puccinia striiformis]|uniref:Uncharacterized protein n=1 Tax=Puccinia striiformis TaxID=27350 RepID=A0A2S4UDK9_9BASI|nr:hypothetical protein PSTT_16340 [Puccinia striiformis]